MSGRKVLKSKSGDGLSDSKPRWKVLYNNVIPGCFTNEKKVCTNSFKKQILHKFK